MPYYTWQFINLSMMFQVEDKTNWSGVITFYSVSCAQTIMCLLTVQLVSYLCKPVITKKDFQLTHGIEGAHIKIFHCLIMEYSLMHAV